MAARIALACGSCAMIKSLAVELLPNLSLDEFIFPGESSSEKLLLQAITQNKSILPDQLNTLQTLLCA